MAEKWKISEFFWSKMVIYKSIKNVLKNLLKNNSDSIELIYTFLVKWWKIEKVWHLGKNHLHICDPRQISYKKSLLINIFVKFWKKCICQ